MRIFFRADGSSTMGLGHIYRVCALAEILGRRDDQHFIIGGKSDENAVRPIVETYYRSVSSTQAEGLDEARDLSAQLSPDDVVILDGYHFDTAYQQAVKESGARLVCVDDIFAHHFVADVVINHAGGISAADYSVEPYTDLLLGPEYAVIRPVFQQAAGEKSSDDLLICLGGADPHNDTRAMLELVRKHAPTLRCHILTGNAYQHERSIVERMETDTNIRLHRNLPADEVAALMGRCGKAICAPSTVSFEYLMSGGELYLKQIADNQTRIMQYWLDRGVAFPVEDFPVTDAAHVKQSLQIQRTIFDGQNGTRLKEAILHA